MVGVVVLEDKILSISKRSPGAELTVYPVVTFELVSAALDYLS
jgi:hypothetical protein